MATIVAFYLGKVILVCVLAGYWCMLLDHVKENPRRKKACSA